MESGSERPPSLLLLLRSARSWSRLGPWVVSALALGTSFPLLMTPPHDVARYLASRHTTR